VSLIKKAEEVQSLETREAMQTPLILDYTSTIERVQSEYKILENKLEESSIGNGSVSLNVQELTIIMREMRGG
jgi:hypothetical protein